MKRTLFTIAKLALLVYVVICGLLFLFQERMIFFPQKLESDHQFNFEQPIEEIRIKTGDGNSLHGILFKADNTKGLIFYLHGNAGSLEGWGKVAGAYTNLGYDVFMLDYRGYGKSESSISSEQELFDDVQLAYDEMKKKYNEENITVLGYSIGTGPAAKLASTNNPQRLILQAPYYSLVDMMKDRYPLVPTFLLKYRFGTYEYVQECKMPVVVFHGDKDGVIDCNQSLRLKQHFKTGDTLIVLQGQGHNGMTDNRDYRREIGKLLVKKELIHPL